jgi:predicted RNA-binding protein with PUA-like domain
MNYWLIKSEPIKYSWDKFVSDKVTFYHSNEGLEIVGIAKIVKEFYQDPTTAEEAWVVVDVAPVKKLKRPVTLAEIKAVPALQDMALIKSFRLSVQPVKQEEWELIMEMAEKIS